MGVPDPGLSPLEQLIWDEDLRQAREAERQRLKDAWQRATPAQRRAIEARAVAELVEAGGTVTVNHGPTCDRVTGKGSGCTCTPAVDVQRAERKNDGKDNIALMRLRQTLNEERGE